MLLSKTIPIHKRSSVNGKQYCNAKQCLANHKNTSGNTMIMRPIEMRRIKSYSQHHLEGNTVVGCENACLQSVSSKAGDREEEYLEKMRISFLFSGIQELLKAFWEKTKEVTAGKYGRWDWGKARQNNHLVRRRKHEAELEQCGQGRGP